MKLYLNINKNKTFDNLQQVTKIIEMGSNPTSSSILKEPEKALF